MLRHSPSAAAFAAKLAAASLAWSIGLLGCAERTVVVQSPSSPGEPVRGLMASGNGEAKAAPDIARTTIGVEARADTVEQASADATARMGAVIEALKAGGVAASDLRTQHYSISYEQEQVPQPPTAEAKAPPVRNYYRVSNLVEVTVRALDKVGGLLQRATAAGANDVSGIWFELEHPEPLTALARERAIANAKANASELARLSGVTLGPIVSISENSGGGPMPMMKASRELAQDVPVERGEVSASVQVQLVYALPE